MELRTARLALRPWAAGDEGALARHADNWNVARHLRDRFPHPYSYEEAVRWVELNERAEGPTLEFAVVHDDEPIGGVGLIEHGDIWRCGIEVGYWIGEPFWGRGFGTEAVAAVVDYAFATFPGIAVVQARHVDSNLASGRLLEKCGFRLEGRLRRAAIKRGVLSDVLVYSITREEAEAATRAAGGGAKESR